MNTTGIETETEITETEIEVREVRTEVCTCDRSDDDTRDPFCPVESHALFARQFGPRSSEEAGRMGTVQVSKMVDESGRVRYELE